MRAYAQLLPFCHKCDISNLMKSIHCKLLAWLSCLKSSVHRCLHLKHHAMKMHIQQLPVFLLSPFLKKIIVSQFLYYFKAHCASWPWRKHFWELPPWQKKLRSLCKPYDSIVNVAIFGVLHFIETSHLERDGILTAWRCLQAAGWFSFLTASKKAHEQSRRLPPTILFIDNNKSFGPKIKHLLHTKKNSSPLWSHPLFSLTLWDVCLITLNSLVSEKCPC